MISLKKKIIVAMSGGVDSSVAAALLAEQGHEVLGVTMRLLPRCESLFGCCGSPEDMAIAKRAAEKIGIHHYILDFSPDFEKEVVDYFVDSYIRGETPNPCIACNRHIKFDKLEKFAQSQNAQLLATGHYARIVETINGSQTLYRLFEAVDSTKDQSYVLYNFDQKALGRTSFPLGNFLKTDVRKMAKKWHLPNSEKKDSQEICFVPDKDYARFVKNNLEKKGANLPSTLFPGPIRDTGGKLLGQHKGISFYTIGQRKGLGLTVPQPFYVIELDASTTRLWWAPKKKIFLKVWKRQMSIGLAVPRLKTNFWRR